MPQASSLKPRDGYILDFISGKEIKSTPEELDAVQPYSKILVNDYNYPLDQIITRPQYRVKSCPSDTSGKFPLDIAIFKGDVKDENLYIIVECKQKNVKEGRSQLEQYLKLSHASLGVWYNGEDAPIFIRKIIKDGGVYFIEIPNIPSFLENIDDIGKFKRKDLKPAHNLKTIFKIIRSHLAGNAVGTTRDEELAKQLINIIFTKIYDEKFTAQDDIVSFRAGINDTPKEVRERIEKIFLSVKGKYKEVIDFNDSISLDDDSLYFIVGQLQNFALIEAERDIIADAFETFIGYALKGSQGQFFTPRNVVKLMVNVLNQEPDETIIDPACGSGGFIVEALRGLWGKLDQEAIKYGWSSQALLEEKTAKAMQQIYGIEKDSFLSKVAKAYMAILGDGKGGIFCEDSLEEAGQWKTSTQQKVRLNSFDCLLANPPFGKNIKVTGKSKLQQFELAYKHKKTNRRIEKTNSLNEEMTPQVLFIERCIQLLRDGGRLGIIIPETYFHAPNSLYVLEYMKRHNVYCIIDLPHNTFRPHNNAKCIAIFLQKNTPQQENILMCVAEEMGHDHQGNPIYRWDHVNHKKSNELWDDFALISDEINSDIQDKYTFKVSAQTVSDTNVYVPRYYWRKKEEIIIQNAINDGYDLVSIGELIQDGVISHFDGHGSPASENKGKGEVPYIRVKDIVNWEIYKDPTSLIPENVYNKMMSKAKYLEEKDIVYVRRGSYRIGSVAMVSPFDKKVILTREILVLRVKDLKNKYGLTPEYLLYALSHNITQEQAKNKILIETTLPNIADRWKELKIPIFKDKNKVQEITSSINDAIKSKWNAVEKINKIKNQYGSLTT